jgi:aminoglycoside phosphotransferase family enzyme
MVKPVSSELVDALLQQQPFAHPVRNLELIETHISWIILTGDIAYKIKKPVNFGFLDFTSLAQRKQYCAIELLLNARTAPNLYLGLTSLYGRPDAPSFEPAVERVSPSDRAGQPGQPLW